MDFLSRLIGGSAPAKRLTATNINNPQQRLNRFKKLYTQILQTWHKSTSIQRLDITGESSIQSSLEKLTNLLHDDTRTPPPHLCLSFAASSHVYTGLTRVALSFRTNELVLHHTLAFLTILIDSSDEEDLVGSQRFAQTLTDFVDKLLGTSVPAEVEEKCLELIFSIAAKIKLEPALLPVWFQSEGDRATFPLCYQFVGHVHSEGRAGDFARTGLLYLFECASGVEKLENWIIDGDLPTMMASGLGALYSQLARKLAISYPDEALPLILALSDNEKRPLPADVETFYSEDLQSRLSTFMSYFVFWQDVLDHCHSETIKQTLVEHFQVFFLQQILYPSLLESSDLDGGSSVAVLTYLWRILDSVAHPDLIKLILHYLLALPEPLDVITIATKTKRATTTKNAKPSLNRRKSVFESAHSVSNDERLNPSFFNLVDLILASVQSSNPQTITGALRLVAVILSKHHTYAISTLLNTVPVQDATPPRPIGALDQEMRTLLSLAHQIGGSVGVDEAFENNLKDAMSSVESHSCSVNKSKIYGASHFILNGTRFTGKSKEMHKHFLDPNAPLFRSLTRILDTFFTNDIEINLAVTSVFSQMASCPFCRLDKWLAMDAMKFPNVEIPQVQTPAVLPADSLTIDSKEMDELEEENRLEEGRLQSYRTARQLPTLTEGNTPSLVKSFQSLESQLRRIKNEHPEFDALLAGRKRAFQGAAEIENEFARNTPAVLSPSAVSETSRDSSVARQIPSRSGTSTPVKPSPHSFLETSSQRGRPLSTIVGQLSASTPRSSPRPAPSTDHKSYRPSPLNSPALRSREGSRGLSRSPVKNPRTLSPLKATHFPPEGYGGGMDGSGPSTPVRSPIARQEEEGVFEKKISFFTTDPEGENVEKIATLTHVLTNAVILQDFVLELAAIVQTRASLLDGEVRFL